MRTRSAVATLVQKSLASILSPFRLAGSYYGLVQESYPGAWQNNVTIDDRPSLLAFSAVFSCINIISNDVAKMPIRLMETGADGISKEVGPDKDVSRQSPFLAVLRRPNRYQNRIQFVKHWVSTKLFYGNVFALKERDERGIVKRLYLLDPNRVQPLVADDGEVYYRLQPDNLSHVFGDQVVVPASEIIHDRMLTLYHPLVGISPLYACALTVTQGNRIQANSAAFFANMSRPSGILSAPGKIGADTAARAKDYWESNFTGATGAGKVAILGDGLTYSPMASTAVESQLVEQLKFTVEDVARVFRVPLYMLAAGPNPTVNNIEGLNRQYYTQTLQEQVESIELCLDEGLSLPAGLATEFDLDAILRMDTNALIDANNKAVGGGWMAANEARKRLNLPPVKGGEMPLQQQQYYPIDMMADRKPPDTKPDDPGAGAPVPADDEDTAKGLLLMTRGAVRQRSQPWEYAHV